MNPALTTDFLLAFELPVWSGSWQGDFVIFLKYGGFYGFHGYLEHTWFNTSFFNCKYLMYVIYSYILFKDVCSLKFP